MKTFLEPFLELSDIQELREELKKAKAGKFFELSGCSEAEKAHVMFGIGHDMPFKLIVTFDEMRARGLFEEYSFYEPDCVLYPGKDLLFYQSDVRGSVQTAERIKAVKALIEEKQVTVITTIDALMNKLPDRKRMEDAVMELTVGNGLSLDKMQKRLISLGYEAVAMTEQPGTFAVRGGILDIFPLTEENPVRIELWGDEIDSIRFFDGASQKSIENLEAVRIYPAAEILIDDDEKEAGIEKIKQDATHLKETYRKEMKTEEAYRIQTQTAELLEKMEEGWGIQEAETYLLYFCHDTCSFLDYFPEDMVLFLDEMGHVEDAAKTVSLSYNDSMAHRMEQGYVLPKQVEMLYSPAEILAKISHKKGVLYSTLDTKSREITIQKHFFIQVVQGTAYNNSFPLLVKDLQKYKHEKYRVMLLSASRTRARRLAQDLMDEGIVSYFSEDYDRVIYPGEVMVSVGRVRRGFEYPQSAFAIIAESDIFGNRQHRKQKKKKYEGEKIAGFSELSIGDYVVHENHGLGIYRGMEKIEVDHIMKDYIKIEYAKHGNLYILATQLGTIQKYSGGEGKKPKLNTLGTIEWQKTKSRVKAAVGEVAKDLVELYALRQQERGYVYGPDTIWQKEFEETFPYEETESQLQAIEDVKKDMQSPKIMDRLICGDVGYGKTEIAIRAAFKAVQENKQVAYLVPTTILAKQQYNNFVQRMKDYPVNVDLLCRFKTAGQQKETLKKLEAGQVDIVIGTHRLLSKDVHFKDLGLLIVDEEQRFGVTHKEKIKQMKKNVDVLSLSATPIPRTLHMSLVGIRDMTVLEEAPMDRQPIQTFVFEYNEEMIREAIVRELARGGQVYYVINQVRTIANVAARIQELVPEANVAYAHGQMHETELEKIMYDFINQDTDVLVATTIIEIGLDISNVNTMIIHDADKLGLSQLYQLRGRVGRSNRTAYAFLMYRKDKMLKEVAEKRLAAIREYTDLGSGFKIALRDLEIRGAGNMLGREQHGQMSAVGYDLYCKMLNEAVRREKGEIVEEREETTVDMNIDAFIPPTYIPDEMQKLDIYKRIAEIENQEGRDEMLDELIDRFGEPPKAVLNLLFISMLRVKAHRAYISEIRQKGNQIRFLLYPDAKIHPEKIPVLLQRYQPYIVFHANPEEPSFDFDTARDSRLKEKNLPDYVEQFVEDLFSLTVDLEKNTDAECDFSVK